MKLKFVYVLVSSENDYFTEQALISMHSLKKHNPEAEIILLTDSKSLESLNEKRNRIKEYFTEAIVVPVPDNLSGAQKNRFIKTSIPKYIDSDFIYLDNDTIITGNLNPLESLDCAIGAVPDKNKHDIELLQYHKYLKQTKGRFKLENIYFNGGVFLVKKSEASDNFFEDWHNKWWCDFKKYNITVDQPTLALANSNNLITEIDGIYNCQFLNGDGNLFIENALICHYNSGLTNTNFFPLKNNNFLKRVREKGISDTLELILKKPQDFIFEGPIILDEEEKNLYQSPMVVLGRKLSRDYPISNIIARFIYRLFGFNI